MPWPATPKLSPLQRRIGRVREHCCRASVRCPPRRPPSRRRRRLDEAAFAAAVAAVRVVSRLREVDEQSKLSRGRSDACHAARIRLTQRRLAYPAQHPGARPQCRVAISVLANNAVSEQEVEAVARNRSWSRRAGLHHPAAGVGEQDRHPARSGARTPDGPSPWPCGSCPSSRSATCATSPGPEHPDAVRTLALRLYRIKRQ